MEELLLGQRYVLSISFGKDSLAMLLLVLEKKLPLDEVVFFNTGMEFECIYKLRDIVRCMLEEKGIRFVELSMNEPFEYMMFEKEIPYRNGTGTHKGYSWCGGRCRWGTSCKLSAIERYCKGAFQYVGIAADEPQRQLNRANKLYPLIEYGMTEADCLNYCYAHGYSWIEDGIELYSILDRVSCWCCANKNLKELRNIFWHLPKYWSRLRALQKRTDRSMKREGSVFELENRFTKEGLQLSFFD